MKNTHTKSTTLVVTIIILGIVCAGIYAYGNKMEGVPTNTVVGADGQTNQGIVYSNKKYGFILRLPTSWSGYKVKSTKITGGENLAFSLPGNEGLFSVDIFSKSQWENMLKDDYPVAYYLGQNDSYAFTFNDRHNGTLQPAASLVKDINSIKTSFNLSSR